MAPAVTSAPASARDQTLERALRDFESVAARLPDEVVPRAVRRRAAEQLERLGWPSPRDEHWRYANLRHYQGLAAFVPASLRSGAAPPASPGAAAADGLPEPLPGFQRLIYRDGVRVADGASGSAHRAATTPAFPAWAVEPAWPPEQRLGWLNDMFAQDSAVLHLAGEAAVELLFVCSPAVGGAAVYPRLQLELAPGARATVIERHLGEPASAALICANVAVELGAGAELTHYRLQQYGTQALYTDTLSARLHAQAAYRVRQLAVGAASARTSGRVRLIGAGASVSWQAIAVGRGEQGHDTELKVEHAAAATRTEEVFRGIADERARVAFSGHIHIESTAAGAEARQSLRGLIEGAGAEIDLRPRLQIDTDQVSAQHGATTGRLDENLLFYLLSRGIEPKVARSLLKWAFLSDVLRTIELPSLRVQAERSAAGQLQDVLAVGALT